MEQCDNGQIKKSLALRAKYRVYKRKVPPMLVVPHPKNRGGDPVKSLRTMQLTAVIVDGYDSIEANSNAIAVEDKPAVAEENKPAVFFFQTEFEKQVNPDPDMAAKGSGMVATMGSLSHSHLNCCLRNILCGKRGCNCVGRKVCVCRSNVMFDEDGNYNIERVRAHDEAWAQDCFSGLEWEVLSHKMDIEEPDAALIISIALNKRNEVAMKTGHLEIMSTLQGLCTPDPHGKVPFDPVRDKMVDLYGADVVDEDLLSAFVLIMDAGGAGSVHMHDLANFVSAYVNPKVRKMRFEVYAIVCLYPLLFPKIKNACVKWSWRQPTVKGWCPMPPSIAHRLQDDRKYGMYELMLSVELAMSTLSDIASTVVDGSVGTDHERTKSRWIAEVEIGLVSKIFAVPKNEVGQTLETQEEELSEQCADFVATKMLELSKVKPALTLDALRGFKNTTSLWIATWKRLEDPQFGRKARIRGNKGAKQNSVVAEALVPKVMLLDEKGRPIGEHETVSKHHDVVETIPWAIWMKQAGQRNPTHTAKNIFWIAHDCMHTDWNTLCPITVVRKGHVTSVLTTQSIRSKALVVPLFVKKPISVVAEEGQTFLHPNSVSVVVSWPPTVIAKTDIEIDKKEEEVRLNVRPEVTFPARDADGSTFTWKPSDVVHPFWLIKREADHSEANAEIVLQDMTHVTACGFLDLSSPVLDFPATTSTFKVLMPFIINTQPIDAGKEVILKWKPTPKKPAKRQADANAFDQIKRQQEQQNKKKAKKDNEDGAVAESTLVRG